ncbi:MULTISPECIES: hypothetical protein [Pantoea]|jgi:hypothetical protein|uniref:Uncharacterized protein n=1 Tax=Pantoea brenneri TaxID=472694 RepID=A0A7Y6NH38_9GAMM|nr:MULTISPECIES: hypothetical protein [Pantoea]MBZ6396982.1 hypothetical protein [Pantoea sp.]MBZ6440267.1 hypothetical protein [Pantoea sp.]NUY43468.1 hypothetical protein [Pantoea brenneri]NUY50966.1 hypothetical protein [Pantoea brenneri]NUY61303.1 hypothetical protein [Pantoea brenneri]
MHVLIRMNWSTQLLLPYDAGMQVLAGLQSARMLESGTTDSVRPLKKDDIQFTILSDEAVTHFGIMNLMGVTE